MPKRAWPSTMRVGLILAFSVSLSSVLSACKSTPLYERTDIHYIQECGAAKQTDQASCAQVQANLTQRCTQEHQGVLTLVDDLYPNRVHVVCRPAEPEKSSAGTPNPEAT